MLGWGKEISMATSPAKTSMAETVRKVSSTIWLVLLRTAHDLRDTIAGSPCVEYTQFHTIHMEVQVLSKSYDESTPTDLVDGATFDESDR